MISREARDRANVIIERAQKMKRAKDFYSQNWPLYEKIFKMFQEDRTGEDSWRADLPDTWSYATIKTAQAAFVESKIMPVFNRHEDEDQAKANDLRDIYVDLAEKGNLETELYFARLDAFKLGTGFLKTIYLEDKRTVQEIQSFDPETKEVTYEKKEINDFDDPITQRVSPYMMLVDEMAKADFGKTARDCIEIEIIGYDDAKRIYGDLVGDWEKEIPKASEIRSLIEPIQGVQVAQDPNNITQITARSYTFFAPIDIADDNVEVLHYYNKLEDTYEILLNGVPVQVKTKQKVSPIPYIHKQLPYTVIQYSPYSGDELWAAGIIETGRAEARAIKLHREMMTDRQKISLFSPVFADSNTEIDQRQLKLRPLSVIRVRGGTPHSLQIPGLSNADLELVRNYEESFKRAVGVDERILGASTDRLRLTATEIGLIRESSLRRLREFSFLYKNALIREVKMKIKLFEQYYASPIKREPRVVDDTGIKQILTQAKQFKVNLGKNVYKKKSVYVSMFEGDIDIDLDMRFLMPITPSESVAKWGQIIRDTLPVTQAIGIDIGKLYKKYFEALEVDITNLKDDQEVSAIKAADGEHALLSNPNTSRGFMELRPDGTPPEFLTPSHISRHQELMQSDSDIGATELKNLADHIAKDIQNIRSKQAEQQQGADQQMLQSPNINQIGGVAPALPTFQQFQPQRV